MSAPPFTPLGPVTVLLFCSVAFWLLPAPAAAHLVTTGLGPVYDGISHVLYSPDDLLPVLAVAFLGGLNGVTAARRALFALTGAWLLGGFAGDLGVFLEARQNIVRNISDDHAAHGISPL